MKIWYLLSCQNLKNGKFDDNENIITGNKIIFFIIYLYFSCNYKDD